MNDLGADILLLMVVPLAVLTTSLVLGHLLGRPTMNRSAPIFVIAAVGAIAFGIRKLVKSGEQLDNLRAGYDAEVAVGQELDQLMSQGAATFHDLPADNFNIDHVVVAPQGVFAVETKGFTKPNRNLGRADATVVFDGKSLRFPTWTTSEPLEQAERQAAWLGKWLSSAIGSPVSAIPVVALPGWFVESNGRSEVRVFSGRQLGGLLKWRNGRALSSQEVERIAHQVEQRCRTVAPRYAGDAVKR